MPDPHDRYREAARRLYGHRFRPPTDGDGLWLTVERDSAVTPVSTGGAFVEAVVWVPEREALCQE